MSYSHADHVEKCDPEKILKWLQTYTSHEHLMDIKTAPSLDKYLAIAPDVYVLAAMLRSALLVADAQKLFGEYGKKETEFPFKPYSELTEEEKTEEEMSKRKIYAAGLRAGRDSALIEMAGRVTRAARQELDAYRLENSEYDPALVVDDQRGEMLE